MASGHVALISPLTLAGKLTSQFWAVRVSCDTMTSGDVDFPAIFSGDLQRSTEEEERTNFGGIGCFVKKHSTLYNQNTRKNSDKWYSEITHAKSQIENRNEAENGSDVTPTSPEETQNARPATFPVSNKKNKKIGADDTCFSNLFSPSTVIILWLDARLKTHKSKKSVSSDLTRKQHKTRTQKHDIYATKARRRGEFKENQKRGERRQGTRRTHAKKETKMASGRCLPESRCLPIFSDAPHDPQPYVVFAYQAPIVDISTAASPRGTRSTQSPFSSLPLRKPQNLNIK